MGPGRSDVAIDDMIGGGARRRPEGTRRSGGRAIVFWVVALVAGGSAAMMLRWYIERSAQPAPALLAKVVVAGLDLPVATTLRADHLKVVDWPESVQPPGVVRDVKELVGRVLVVRVVRGEPILSSKLASRDAGRGLAALIPDGMRAVAVRVDEVVGVAGFIHPEDRVDVIATLRPPKPDDAEPTSKVILQNVKVLAVGKELEVEENSRDRGLPVTVATLLVSPSESEKLALAATNSRLLLSLRSWTDGTAVDTPGANPSALLSGVDVGGRTRSAAPVAVVETGKRGRHGRVEPPPSKGSQVAATPQKEVVEILRGDRFEERKFDKDKP
jgi:pilus assembly protein CpaB